MLSIRYGGLNAYFSPDAKNVLTNSTVLALEFCCCVAPNALTYRTKCCNDGA
ncbi:hypothetical protein AURDEDRAFT_168332 [Auricularia subglabra TFB-10046 SS5]|nr:hypothetical protein AURDEDRAFT_168332 [Auricularia subglabra TFB-10046 SS5]